ncbi:hypothetical protein RF55_13035 [Lasius niger]|uniref:Uncharacterized protein n=1 Tax=Lasius niger TaxID=67767 RepID=A0A0J7KBH7_LASNI|nr:hypothetical protein RF55_13035 [Lasius niger]
MVLEKERDRDELLERSVEINRRWEISVDEDLTREERKLRWRIGEKARVERRRGRKVVADNRKIWIEGRKWRWNEEKRNWMEGEDRERRIGKGKGGKREGRYEREGKGEAREE